MAASKKLNALREQDQISRKANPLQIKPEAFLP
jgi:hypothetical protein